MGCRVSAKAHPEGAVEEAVNVPCALKILNKVKVATKNGSVESAAEAIRHEAEILGQLEFPFIVGVLKVFQDPRRVFVLMEFCTGGELYKVIHSRDRVPKHIAQFWIGELVLTLEHLNKYHIVYRDLKPENCMLDQEGHIKMVDFGMAKRLDPKRKFRTRTNCGTLIYQPPEMLLNRSYSIEPDWWSLGVMIFELFTLRFPWDWSRDHHDEFNIQQAILAVNIRWGRSGRGIDRATKSLIKRLLVYNPKKRIAGLIAKVKDHKFFKGLEWNLLLNKQIPVPYVPGSIPG
ncbi:cAMP-dependent protein kinase catalytic subunit, putative [Perkinsus marinus ATCC 50983]|uniref:cAMP-dependent protein kinase catalytic subunit, putative n=1 Tax=Perkinsus marinus (strain ATCC 50983 / TXsc) TaxID=423536 RepID=C5LKM6_PERM5|nr:cAMP-dependent protein kinase catalytic subunit, putative [Perkinsus marinus ATCC 50983]EER02707.1 cAMP-dependent protein kinase catalytic subunit, putative [Perkinsus marinus ATCC 50983]|eukprot:XP_002770692.1 cAMP-dependent protein kinase catalytic subunit, putative [Perkinsus marinus ATCC 50983]